MFAVVLVFGLVFAIMLVCALEFTVMVICELLFTIMLIRGLMLAMSLVFIVMIICGLTSWLFSTDNIVLRAASWKKMAARYLISVNKLNHMDC